MVKFCFSERKGEDRVYMKEFKKISLYCVPTPIGNLSDMSPRALEVLRTVDFIAAEDTRKSGILLKHFDVKKPMISYFEHNRKERGEIILKRLSEGEVCALITDAGTPAISDPGEELVRQCIEMGLRVSSLPGPCAVTTALSMSGLPTGRFCFEGFLSVVKNVREKHLASLEEERRTMVFYEAPHKLRDTLIDMYRHFGDRKISLVREISKIYEETKLTTLSEAASYYENNLPKGEFVLVVEGLAENKSQEIDREILSSEFEELVREGRTKSDASKILADRHGLRKRDIYELFKNISI